MVSGKRGLSAQHAVREAGVLFSNPLEELILGYTVAESTPQSATRTARTWWCLPYAKVRVTKQGATPFVVPEKPDCWRQKQQISGAV